MNRRTESTAMGPICISEENGRIRSLSTVPEDDVGGSRELDEAFLQLNGYLEGRRKDFDLRYEPEGTPFQKKVWDALMEIPYGETVSYGELAKRIGHPGASRAVGGAVKRNPVPIFIPCHRVVRSDGSLGGYNLGVDMKKALLRTEGHPHECP